jgi:ankyrin repeat protein
VTLHELLDFDYKANGNDLLHQKLDDGADPNRREGPCSETPLHVATRRFRPVAVELLLNHGAKIDAKTRGGKTAYAHAVRRGFNEIAERLRTGGASTEINEADRLAVAIVTGRLNEASSILAENPDLVRTGNPEEDRLLADVAGRSDTAPVELLIRAGADISAAGLDSGTPLHQAAWFGQPDNARLLIDAGAPLDLFEGTHESSPVGWAVHGSRYSGGAEERQDDYVKLVQMFLKVGSSLHYPESPTKDNYFQRLLKDSTPQVREVLLTGAPR